MNQTKIKKAEPLYYWHIHHEVLIEKATEPTRNRISYIKSNKPKDEIETRLRLLKPVKNQRKAKVYEETRVAALKVYEETRVAALKVYKETRAAALKVYDETRAAWKVYDKTEAAAWNVYNETRVAAGNVYNETTAAARKDLELLHKKECLNCPWDGHTIFPKRK